VSKVALDVAVFRGIDDLDRDVRVILGHPLRARSRLLIVVALDFDVTIFIAQIEVRRIAHGAALDAGEPKRRRLVLPMPRRVRQPARDVALPARSHVNRDVAVGTDANAAPTARAVGQLRRRHASDRKERHLRHARAVRCSCSHAVTAFFP